MGSPRGPREGPPVSDPGGVARQGADVACLPGGGGGAPHHGCGRQLLAPPGYAQRPHPLALPPAKPATAAALTPTQAAAQVTAQTTGAREWGGDSAAGRPPLALPGPPANAPPTIQRDGEARATSRGREGGANERGGGGHCPAAHEPLTADPHGCPQPASAARRRQGEQGAQARACMRARLSQGRGGQGKSAPPGRKLAPQGQNCQAASPQPSGGGVGGPEGPPIPPPPAQERTGANQRDSGPARPRGGRCTEGRGHRGRGKRGRAPSAPG